MALMKRPSVLTAACAAAALILFLRWKNKKAPMKPVLYQVVVRPDAPANATTAYVVTGGAGMLGGHIMAQLRERYPEAKVISLDLGIPPASKRHENCMYIRCDLGKPDQVRQALEEALSGGAILEAVLHIAAILPALHVTRELFDAVNVTGTARLCDMAVEHGARAFIYCSSATAVLNLTRPILDGVKGEELPYPADHEFVDNYGRSKAKGEQEVLRRNGVVTPNGHKLLTTALRISGVVDANDRAFGQNLPRGFNNVYFGDGGNVLDWVWAVDVATAFIAATRAATKNPESIAGKPFHIGGFTRKVTFKEWLNVPDPEKPGTTLWGNRLPPIAVNRWIMRFAAYLNVYGYKVLGFAVIDPMLRPDTIQVTDGTMSWWFDLGAAKTALNYEPTPVDSVIRTVRDQCLGLISSGEGFARRGRLPTL